eukprot:RCo035747
MDPFSSADSQYQSYYILFCETERVCFQYLSSNTFTNVHWICDPEPHSHRFQLTVAFRCAYLFTHGYLNRNKRADVYPDFLGDLHEKYFIDFHCNLLSDG